MDIIKQNHAKYLERGELFKMHGYDRDKERDLIIERAQPIKGEILEIGTGKGAFTIALAEEGYYVTTVDVSREEHEFARMNIAYLGLESHVRFMIGNAKSLDMSDGSYDTVFAINVVHHLEDPFNVVDEMMRITAQNGKIIMSDFNEYGFEVIHRIHMSEGRDHHVNKKSLHDVEKYVAIKGYSIDSYESVCQKMIIIHKGE